MKSKKAKGPSQNPEKDKLEIKKIELEIKNLNLPWYQKPSYLGVILPVVVAFLALMSAWITGYFDTERKLLELEKTELKASRDSLQTSVKELDSEYDSLNSLLSDVRQEIETLANDITMLKSDTTALRKERNILKNSVDVLQRSVNEKERYIEMLVTKSNEILDKLDTIAREKDGEIAQLLQDMNAENPQTTNSLRNIKDKLDQIQASIDELDALLER